LLLQVTLFVSGVLEGEAELRRLLTPFGDLVRAFVMTNPQVLVTVMWYTEAVLEQGSSRAERFPA
jgi:hypothetical protein